MHLNSDESKIRGQITNDGLDPTFKLYELYGTNSITVCGRDSILKIRDALNNEFPNKVNLRVIEDQAKMILNQERIIKDLRSQNINLINATYKTFIFENLSK